MMMQQPQRGADIPVCRPAKPGSNVRTSGLRPAADRNVCPTDRRRAARRRGFTLAEVLISLGIFAIGMIAVASLFPVAAILQKETADDILGTQATRNARATIEAVGLTYLDPSTAFADDLDEYYSTGPTTNTVRPIGVGPSSVSPSSFLNRYTVRDRSYPTTEADTDERDHYWFFFARDSAGNPASPSWQGFIIVVDREDGQDYNDVAAGLTFGDPTGVVDQGTPYITIDGKTGNWDVASPPAFVGAGVYYHPNGIGVETFTFETTP